MRLSFKQFLIETSKLLLKLDDLDKWIETPHVLKWFSIWFFSIMLIFLLELLMPLINCLTFIGINSSLVIRTARIVIMFWILISFVILSLRYYKFILLEDKELKFSNILFFYFGSIFFFGYLYFTIYHLNPSAFTYTNPPYVVTEVMKLNPKNYISALHFMIYSALISVSSTYYRIDSNSTSISLLGIFQKLYNIFIIVIVFSSFIQKAIKPYKD